MVGGHLVKVRQSGNRIEFRSSVSEESIKPLVEFYFGLNCDIRPVHEVLRQDSVMAGLVDRYGGMRLLRQDPWECLVAYICSGNNNIKRITEIINMLADRYGDPLEPLDGVNLHSFPAPERLLEVGEAELNDLKLGLNRGSLIHAVAKDKLDLNALREAPYAQAKERLMRYKGIGPKIADCVCLFSLDKPEAFPVDTHIGDALWKHYGKKYTPGAKNAKLLKWAREHFGPDAAGYAGQLLFYEQIVKTSPQPR